jgi:hypothetical protein
LSWAWVTAAATSTTTATSATWASTFTQFLFIIYFFR